MPIVASLLFSKIIIIQEQEDQLNRRKREDQTLTSTLYPLNSSFKN
jgi:hypothetical protein